MIRRESVTFSGLRTQPLASYLGALGVLRILSTQHSRTLGAVFSADGFRIVGISETDAVEFLLDRWRPSPVVTPWNNASGFYTSSKGRLAASAMQSIIADGSERFSLLVETIERVRGLVTDAKYAEAPEGEGKARFIAHLRSVLADEAVAWLDAVAVVDGNDARMMPFLGSGGNEGVLDYSGLFLRSIVDTLLGVRARSERLLRSALFGTPCGDLVERPGGQFDPGSAGGFNTGFGFESKDLPNNPWTFLLLIEGAMVWASAVASRQLGLEVEYRFAVSPFTVRHRAAGYGSASQKDNDPQRVRAEVWVPVWERVATLAEISHFISEGRVDVRGPGASSPRRAEDSLDFADAVATLGVDRGVTSFVRYALIKRRGDSYLALPAGVLPVAWRREADLLRELDRELVVLDQFIARFPSEQGPPAQLSSARRAIDEARFDVAARGGSMTRLVQAIGALEMLLARRDPGKAPQLWRPLGGLSAQWVEACEDRPEVRIAAALASIRSTGDVGPIRNYLAPVDARNPRRYAPAPRAASWIGQDVSDRLANVLSRRLLDAERTGAPRNPTFGTRSVTVDDIASFLAPGATDDGALEELLFGFTWVQHDTVATSPARTGPHALERPAPPLPRSFLLLRLLFSPSGIPGREEPTFLSPDAAILGLLRAGRVREAVSIATRRLRSGNIHARRVTGPDVSVSPELGRRLAAALLIPMKLTRALVEAVKMPDATHSENS